MTLCHASKLAQTTTESVWPTCMFNTTSKHVYTTFSLQGTTVQPTFGHIFAELQDQICFWFASRFCSRWSLGSCLVQGYEVIRPMWLREWKTKWRLQAWWSHSRHVDGQWCPRRVFQASNCLSGAKTQTSQDKSRESATGLLYFSILLVPWQHDTRTQTQRHTPRSQLMEWAKPVGSQCSRHNPLCETQLPEQEWIRWASWTAIVFPVPVQPTRRLWKCLVLSCFKMNIFPACAQLQEILQGMWME